MPLTTQLSELIRPALRMAGITTLPGITPNTDQSSEMVSAVNRMLQSWNTQGHLIFATTIVAYDLNSGQKVYSIGPTGDLATSGPRPQYIKDANLIFPTNPQLRYPLKSLDEHEWSLIPMQDIGNSLPWCYYYDATYGTSGLGTIYLAFQPPEGYQLELYTWTPLPSFTDVTNLVILPDGYEEAITYNLAVRASTLYPLEAKMSPDTRQLAKNALDNLITLNTVCPTLRSEAEFLGRGNYWQWSGMFAANGGGGGGSDLQSFSISGSITGTTGSDGNAVFTLSATPTFLQLFNGLIQVPGLAYTRSGSVITFLAPYIPTVGSTLYAVGTV